MKFTEKIDLNMLLTHSPEIVFYCCHGATYCEEFHERLLLLHGGLGSGALVVLKALRLPPVQVVKQQPTPVQILLKTK
jgi:hypothetical protein